MEYNVELYIARRKIEQIGKSQAFEWALFEAWYRTFQGAKPKRSIRLVSTEVDEYEEGGPHAYKVRYLFLVDSE